MKTFEEQNKILIEFDKTFDSSDFRSCVKRAMLLIRNREAQMIEEGYQFPISVDSCKWAVEQEIINRDSSESMMSAAIRYVESVEYRAEQFNGLVACLTTQTAAGRIARQQGDKMNKSEIALHCTSGLIQYASSIESILNIYNENGKLYEIQKDSDGNYILCHKGHKRSVGIFKLKN